MSTKISAQDIREMKTRGELVPALTAYDYPMSRLLDEAGIPVLLVGDSLGMVVLGYENTTHVTMQEMEHHVRAVARAKPKALVVADLPFRTYLSPQEAVANSRRLIDAGANAVKAEGGRSILPQVRAILSSGIPFMGHLGMLPQHVLEEGGYRVKGKIEREHQDLLADALALEHAGTFAIVLELVTPPVAADISQKLRIPTIGIGSGKACDGQVLVTPDLLGMLPWVKLKHVQPKMRGGEQIMSAVREWMRDLKSPLESRD